MITLKQWAFDNNTTMAQMSRRLGYHKSYLSLLNSGKRKVSIDVRLRFIKVYGAAAYHQVFTEDQQIKLLTKEIDNGRE